MCLSCEQSELERGRPKDGDEKQNGEGRLRRAFRTELLSRAGVDGGEVDDWWRVVHCLASSSGQNQSNREQHASCSLADSSHDAVSTS